MANNHKTSNEKHQRKANRALLVKDLACRLPYHNTTLLEKEGNTWKKVPLDVVEWTAISEGMIDIENVKVILKPMNTIGSKDIEGLVKATFGDDYKDGEILSDDWIKFIGDGTDIEFIFFRRSYKDVLGFYDYCYSHNLDVNRLGEVGLAEDPVLSDIVQ